MLLCLGDHDELYRLLIANLRTAAERGTALPPLNFYLSFAYV